MKQISLITVYNNKSLLDEMIESAKNQQNIDIEYILIDNRKHQYSSAARALNYGADSASGDVFVFLHQDIEFVSQNALDSIYEFAVNNKNVVFGSAGVKHRFRKEKIKVLSAMWEGVDRDGVEWKAKYNTLTKPEKCFTLDECLIACHRNCMNYIRFDEDVCDGWHLYGADLCLQAGLIDNLEVMVVPMDYVWHKSKGKVDKSYLDTQIKLAKKYRGYYKTINTTNGFQYTNPFLRMLLNLYRKRYIG